MSASSNYITLIPFDGKDFPVWKIKVCAYIGGRGWSDIVTADSKIVSPTVTVTDDGTEQKVVLSDSQLQANAFLVNSLSNNILSLFASYATGNPAVLWGALVKHYERDTVASKHATRALMMGQRLGEGEDISVYVSRINSYAQKLRLMGDNVTEGDLLFCLYHGLSTEYDALKSILQLKDGITYAAAVQHLKDHYELTHMNKLVGGTDDSSTALFVNHNGGGKGKFKGKKKPWCENHKFYGHATKDCRMNNNKEKANAASGGSGKPYCKIHKNNTHSTMECRNITCHECGEKGHIKRNCKKGKQSDDEKSNMVVNNNYSHSVISSEEYSAHVREYNNNSSMFDYDAMFDMACTTNVDFATHHVNDDISATKYDDDDDDDVNVIHYSDYILDSGATSHYINDIRVLDDVVELSTAKSVMVANSQKVNITKMGTVNLVGDYGDKISLKDVRYVPSFNTNLVSVSKLTNAGGKVVFDSNGAKLIKNGKTLLTAHRVGNLYYVNVQQSNNSEKANGVSEDLSLFHQRSGHLGLSTIKHVVEKNAVLGIDYLKGADITAALSSHTCHGCELGKSHRTAFKSYSLKPVVDNVCNRIYCDLSGPINVNNLDGNLLTIYQSLGSPKYLSAIVDEKSRFLTGKLLRNKSDTATHIINFINYAENLQQNKVKFFHSDGGGEYINNTLSQYFTRKGIKVETTCTDTPQHNGVVERANRIIFNMARSMLQHSHLPVVFWGEAVLTACYLMNFRLCVNDKTKTAHEVWYGDKPYVQHLRVFGCDAYVHVHKGNRDGKMGARAVKGIFIGYDKTKENGYRIFNISNNSIIVSRDVKFYEKSFTAAREIISDSSQPLPSISLSTPGPMLDLGLDNLSVVPSVSSNSPSLSPISDPMENKYVEDSDIAALQPVLSSAKPAAPAVSEPIPSTATNNNQSSVTNSRKHYEVEKLLDYKKTNGKEFFLVKWQGYPDSENSWQPRNNLNKQCNAEMSRLRDQYKLQTSLSSASQTSTTNTSSDTSDPTPSIPSTRSGRVVKPSNYYYNIAHAAIEILDSDMPKSYTEAVNSNEGKQWREAIDEEIKSLNANDTFVYVKRDRLGKGVVNVMGCRWLFRVKLNADGNVERYKARLVAQGFTQKEGIDYHETFAPVVKYKSLRIILALANLLNYEIKQMDVVTAFLNAKLDEDVYMQVPQGFKHWGDSSYILKLHKSLYGTKQAPHMWNNDLNAFVVSIGFSRLSSDTCVYVKQSASGNILVISVFVDDIIIAYSNKDEKEWMVVKKLFLSKYKMKDMGDASWILGMKVIRDREKGVLCLDQSLYLNKVLSRFNMLDCKPAPTPESGVKLSVDMSPSTDEEKAELENVPYKSVVGSLLYAALGTRPDIAHAVNEISKFMENPGHEHWVAAKRILHYIKGTVNKALVFDAKDSLTGGILNISAYSDSNWAGDINDRKSTTGYIVQLGKSSVIWNTKKQKTVCLSSAEAEYMALSSTVQEVKWVAQFFKELLLPCVKLVLCITVYVDNQAAILISKNDVYHDRTKHIDIRYHFVRDAVQEKLFIIKWVPTDYQLADGLTKALSTIKFTKLFNVVMNQF
jgi:hypothetical protein